MASQTHDKISIRQVKNLNDSCLFFGTSREEVIANKAHSETTELIRLQLVD